MTVLVGPVSVWPPVLIHVTPCVLFSISVSLPDLFPGSGVREHPWQCSPRGGGRSDCGLLCLGKCKCLSVNGSDEFLVVLAQLATCRLQGAGAGGVIV